MKGTNHAMLPCFLHWFDPPENGSHLMTPFLTSGDFSGLEVNFIHLTISGELRPYSFKMFLPTQAPQHGAGHTVDGSEIRRSPVEVGSFSHYLQGLHMLGGPYLP